MFICFCLISLSKEGDVTEKEACGIGCSSCSVDVSEELGSDWKRKTAITIIAGAIPLAIGLYLEFFTDKHILAQVLFFISAVLTGFNIGKKGIYSLIFDRRLSIDFLIFIAALGSFLIGHGEEGAAVVILFFIAESLEEYAADRARKSVASLLKLAPETAVVRRNGEEVAVHTHEVEIGDIVIVKPGDKIPLDGIVVKGFSSVNQAPITGESVPVSKREGDRVFAGTINEEGYLEIEVDRKSEESTLSKIVKLVEEAQGRKSKTEVFVDRFARYYTPVVIGLAVLVMTVPTLAFGLPFKVWFYRALVLLVVSCPCALAISTPVSMVSALTSAARNGVLIKGGNFIEEMRNMKVLVFDKTGTLTEGKLEVTDVVPLNNYTESELIKIAASLESMSGHPIAEAIVRKAAEEGVGALEVTEFRSVAGQGLQGQIEGNLFFAGNRAFLEEKGIDYPLDVIEGLEREGKTVVLIGHDDRVVGTIALMDRIRDNSLETVKRLKEVGVKTVMLTGDNQQVAAAVASKLGIDEYYAELLPEDKVRIVEELLETNEHVVMVGDGVNDAPALARAHVGIAMGVVGSDVAIETADIALMHDNLSGIVYLLELSRKTMSVVKQNVFASILIKGSFAVLAFPGIITLWLAVAVGDMGLSLAVILNALRIGKMKWRNLTV